MAGTLAPLKELPNRYRVLRGTRVNKKLSNSLVLGVEEKGQGNIVYLVDNPLFQCFWESGKMVFSKAVFIVGQ